MRGACVYRRGSPLSPDQSRRDRSWASPPRPSPSFTQNDFSLHTETFVMLIRQGRFPIQFHLGLVIQSRLWWPLGTPVSLQLYFSRSCCLTPLGAASQMLRPVMTQGSEAACPQPGHSPASVLQAVWSGLFPTPCSLLVLLESGAGSSGLRRPGRRQHCSRVN